MPDREREDSNSQTSFSVSHWNTARIVFGFSEYCGTWDLSPMSCNKHRGNDICRFESSQPRRRFKDPLISPTSPSGRFHPLISRLSRRLVEGAELRYDPMLAIRIAACAETSSAEVGWAGKKKGRLSAARISRKRIYPITSIGPSSHPAPHLSRYQQHYARHP